MRRLRAIWQVVRGRPLVYRAVISGRFNFGPQEHLMVLENVFRAGE